MILVCAASNGKNLELANLICRQAEAMSESCEVLDLTELDWPVYTPQRQEQGLPETLEPVRAKFAGASALFICAPEYNGAIPPTLNNTIAWLSVLGKDFRRLFNAKPVGLATHSGSMGQKALTVMRIQLSHLGCNVIGREVLTNKNKAVNPESVDSILRQLIKLSAD